MPRKRYSSVAEMLDAIDPAFADEHRRRLGYPPLPWWRRVWRWLRRRLSR